MMKIIKVALSNGEKDKRYFIDECPFYSNL